HTATPTPFPYTTLFRSARPQQRGIQNVRAVRRGDQDYPFVRLKTVHLHEQRVQRLLAFVMSAAEACTAMPSDRVNFVDEDDAGRSEEHTSELQSLAYLV